MSLWLGDPDDRHVGEPKQMTSFERVELTAINKMNHIEQNSMVAATASNEDGDSLSFGGKTKGKRSHTSAHSRHARNTIMAKHRNLTNLEENRDASAFFAEKLPGAWKEKLWDIVGISSGTNIYKQAENRKVVERDYRNKKKRGALDAMQKARLSRELMHRPTRETLFNIGVLNRGGLLSIIEWNRLYKNDDDDDSEKRNGEKREGGEESKAGEGEQNGDSIQRAYNKNSTIRYPGRPGYVPLPRLCVSIACGESHTLAIIEGGSVFLWGKNGSGQLGFPADKHNVIHEPHLLMQLKGVVCMSAACGKNHCVVVTEGGGVYTWGAGERGQLGTNNISKTGNHDPVRVEHRRMWVSLQSTSRNGKERPIVCCGEYHCGICSVRGDIWIWGDNTYGQVYGVSQETDDTIPDIVASPINAMYPASKASGPSFKKTSLLIKSKVQTIALLTGSSTSSADQKKERSNHVPLLTLVPGEVIKKLVTGTRHTVVMTSHGALWGWGDNSHGQLGNGNHHKHHHHHHHHHHHKMQPKKRRGSLERNNKDELTTRAQRLHLGGVNREEHHNKKERRKSKNDHQKDESKNTFKTGMSMPILFSSVEAGSTFTAAFSVAGEMWMWGHLDGVKGFASGNGKQSVRLLSNCLPGRVHGGEIVCNGNTLLVNTKLGVFSIERNGNNQNISTLVARRISILDGQDIHSLQLSPGPRLFAILSHQKSAGMQVVRLKEGNTQNGSLEIKQTVGDHLKFEVSLRTHPSVNATTRHGIIRRANYLALTTRVEPSDESESSDDLLKKIKNDENIKFNKEESKINTEVATDSVKKSWAPWDDIDVQVVGPFRDQVQLNTSKPDVPYRVNASQEVVDIDISSKTAGTHWLNVTFHGAHVLGSPFCFHTLVGPPVLCDIKGHADSIGLGIMRIGVAHLLNVTMYDKYKNRCVLGPAGTSGCVDMNKVKLLVDGKIVPASCSAPAHSGATVSLLFNLDVVKYKPTPKVRLTVSVEDNLVEGHLTVRSVHMIEPKDVVVNLPKRAVVGAPIEIKMGTTTENNPVSDGGEKFVVTVIGPKARSGSKGSGFNDLPINVRDHGDGSYMCVVWPHLPGVHLVAVQHVSYKIVEESGHKKQVKILHQVPGSPYRFQALLPQAGSARRRRVVGSHLDKLNSIFTRLDIDQDGTVPSSSLASEMKREGSVSRLLDGQSLDLMLGEGEITRDKFVESLVGSLPPELFSEDEEGEGVMDVQDDKDLERAALRIQAVQRGRKQRQMIEQKKNDVVLSGRTDSKPWKKQNEVVSEAKDSRVEGISDVQIKTRQIEPKTAKEEILQFRRNFPRGIQMRIVDSNMTSANTKCITQQQQQQLQDRQIPQRPSSAKRAGGRQKSITYRRSASARKRIQHRSTDEGNAWNGLSLRKEVRKKLLALQNGPYGKDIPRARRPKAEHQKHLPKYTSCSTRLSGRSGNNSTKQVLQRELETNEKVNSITVVLKERPSTSPSRRRRHLSPSKNIATTSTAEIHV